MTLNDFIARACAWFDKAEDSAKLIANYEAKLNELGKTIEAQAAALKDSAAKLDTAEKASAGFQVEIVNLKAAVEKATTKADDVLAAQGVPPAGIPAPKPDETATASAGIIAKLDAITDPAAKADFFRKNKAAIYEARRRS